MTRTLVAGVGNLFFGDDGFGVEVAARLAKQRLPEGVRVIDAGISARHLAYELVEGGYSTAILIDAMPRDGAPGTVYLVEAQRNEPGQQPPDATRTAAALMDGHGMTPDLVLELVRLLGGTPPRMLVVGCEPESIEPARGLSTPVACAVDEAVGLVRRLVAEV